MKSAIVALALIASTPAFAEPSCCLGEMKVGGPNKPGLFDFVFCQNRAAQPGRRFSMSERAMSNCDEPAGMKTTSTLGACLVVYDGVTLHRGPCSISGPRDAPSLDAMKSGYFMDVGEGVGRWNGEPGGPNGEKIFPAPKAHMPLRDLKREGMCWFNARFRACILDH